jgi:hypothetical protein
MSTPLKKKDYLLSPKPIKEEQQGLTLAGEASFSV